MMSKIKTLFSNNLFLLIIWLGATAVCCLMKCPSWECYNNYAIFNAAFGHAANELPLYSFYDEYLDQFLYGISFTLIMIPFHYIPEYYGMILWCLMLSGFLFYSIKSIGLENSKFVFIALFTVNELYTSILLQQFNIAVAAMLILSFVLVERKKDFWATMIIAFSALVKIYGLAGLAFFLFSKDKIRFTWSFIFWFLVFLFLPLLYCSPEYLFNQYQTWFDVLSIKNNLNFYTDHTNISFIGMLDRIFSFRPNSLWIMLPGVVLYCLPFLRLSQYKNYDFRISFLYSAMLFVVLFSSGSENSSYITPIVAAAIWFVTTPTKDRDRRVNIALMILCFIFTSLTPTDIFPRSLRYSVMIPYSLKALPCLIIWIKILYEQLTCYYLHKID